MRLSTLAVALSGVFMTVSTASLKPELYESALTDRVVPIDGISTTCGICIYQCMAYVFICAVACGPGELLGPIACAVCPLSWADAWLNPLLVTELTMMQNCLIVAGASQQCFQCVEKCEGKVLLENCSAATNQ